MLLLSSIEANVFEIYCDFMTSFDQAEREREIYFDTPETQLTAQENAW